MTLTLTDIISAALALVALAAYVGLWLNGDVDALDPGTVEMFVAIIASAVGIDTVGDLLERADDVEDELEGRL